MIDNEKKGYQNVIGRSSHHTGQENIENKANLFRHKMPDTRLKAIDKKC